MHQSSSMAAHLLRIGAIKINAQHPYIWSSGWKSPIYCDNRLLLSYPEIRTEVRRGFEQLTADLEGVDGVAGVATAGIPHGMLLADALELPFIYVRGQAKGHGRQVKIEGDASTLHRVVVIEDLISTGGSSADVVETLRANGTEVAAVLAIFSYGFDTSRDRFEKLDVPFATLLSLDDLLKQAEIQGGISSDEKSLIESWRLSPQTWGQ